MIFRSLIWLAFLGLASAQEWRGPSQPCKPELCQLPDCRCSSTEIPGGLDPRNTPQVRKEL